MMAYFKKAVSVMALGFTFLSFNAFSAVSNCKPTYGGTSIQQNIGFDITTNSTSIGVGTQLASARSSFINLTCDFTGSVSAPNHIYFKNTMSPDVKALLVNSGVTVTQQVTIGGGPIIAITNPNVPNLDLGSWLQPSTGTSVGIGIMYNFTVQKSTNALKPFDTGNFLLGHHEDYQGNYLGVPVYVRIVGNLTLLCPAPAVHITASNGGNVNFGAVSPQQMNAGEVVSRSFNLGMSVPQDCETGLNISVRFEPNNNTVLGNKYLDMGNGLQTLLKSNATEINYNQNYVVGEILPQTPVSVPYTAILSQIPGSTISSGAFSKTIRVVVSY